MAEINKQRRKSFEIKFQNRTTMESVQHQIDNSQQLIKCKLSTNNCEIFDSLVEKTFSFLKKKTELIQLKFEINFLQNFDIMNLQCSLIQLTQLQSLDLFFYNVHFKFVQSLTLGECLRCLVNLTKLKLSFQGEKSRVKLKYLNMCQAYQNFPNLISLDLNFQSEVNAKSLIDQCFEGLQHLKKLKVFKLYLSMALKKETYIVSCLDEEITKLPNLNEISLKFGFDTIISQKILNKLGFILLKIKSLRKLEFEVYQKISDEIIGQKDLYNYFDQFYSLTHLQLKLNNESCLKLNLILNSISKLPNLEETIIDMKIGDKDNEDFLNNLGKRFSLIPSLSSLSIQILKPLELSTHQIIQFISLLKPLERLTKLEIITSQKYQPNENLLNQTEYLQAAVDVVCKLLSFKFDVEENSRQQSLSTQIAYLLQNVTKLKNLILIFRDGFNFVKNKIQIQRLIQNLKNLKQFQVSFENMQQINSSELIQIFEGLQQNTELETFKIEVNRIKNYNEQIFQNLKDGLMNLKQLQTLFLKLKNTNPLHMSGQSNLIEAIKQMSLLKELSLEFINTCSGDFTLQFLTSLQCLSQLNRLELSLVSKYQFTQEQLQEMNDNVQLPNQLEYLWLTLGITGLQFSHLTNLFKQISSLEYLWFIYLRLQNINPTREESAFLKEQLSKVNDLYYINLIFYSFNLLCLTSLFSQLHTLDRINLGICDDCEGYYDSITIQKKIIYKEKQRQIDNEQYVDEEIIFKQIHLCLDQKFFITCNEIKDIQYCFQNMQNLTHLELIVNQKSNLYQEGSFLLFQSISYLINLQCLNLNIEENNNITTQNLLILGEEICKLNNLQSLSLKINSQDNNINWHQSTEFLKEMGSLKLLESFSFNILSDQGDYLNFDSIGETLMQLSNLKHLCIIFHQNINFQMNSEKLDEMFLILKQRLKSIQLKIYNFVDKEQFNQIIKGIRQLDFLQSIQLMCKSRSQNYLILKMKRLINQELFIEGVNDLEFDEEQIFI